jgi:hypothetical protein
MPRALRSRNKERALRQTLMRAFSAGRPEKRNRVYKAVAGTSHGNSSLGENRIATQRTTIVQKDANASGSIPVLRPLLLLAGMQLKSSTSLLRHLFTIVHLFDVFSKAGRHEVNCESDNPLLTTHPAEGGEDRISKPEGVQDHEQDGGKKHP